MNVLFIFTDQQQRGSLGAYGNTIVKTPNIDRLASQGATFESAICPAPVCTPSRCSFLTGVYPHTHGIPCNYDPLPMRIPTLAEMVLDHGVRTGFLGKWHLGREVLPQRGFEVFRAVDDNYTAYRDLPFYGLSGYGRWLVEKGYEPDGGDGRFTREFTSRLPEQLSKPAYISEETCRFLDVRQKEQFVLCCSFLEPHNPYHSEYDDLHDRASIPLPDNFCTTPRDNWPKRNIAFQEWAKTVAHGDEEAFDSEEKWRDVIARYYGACHLVDNHVGIILSKLEELGLADDTMVIYSSDHGDMMGSHGMYLKSMMFEESLGVPLIIKHPQTTPRRITEPTNMVNLVPTMLDVFDIPVPDQVQGKSLMPLLTGEREETPDAIAVGEWNGVIQRMFSRNEMFASVKDQFIRSIRTRRWKLNVADTDLAELYDLENDPGETTNLIHQSEHHPVIKDLFARLRQWQRTTGDAIQLPSPI